MKSKRINGINIYYDDTPDDGGDVSKDFRDAIQHLGGLDEDEFKGLISSAKKKDHKNAQFEIGYLKTKFQITYNGMRYHLELLT